MVTEIGNPTLQNLKEEIMSKTINKWVKAQHEILEAFLAEYIEVNEIEEAELKNYVELIQTSKGVFVREGENTILEIRWEKIIEPDYYSLVMTPIISNSEKYQKTAAIIRTIKGKDTKMRSN